MDQKRLVLRRVRKFLQKGPGTFEADNYTQGGPHSLDCAPSDLQGAVLLAFLVIFTFRFLPFDARGPSS